MITFEPQPKKEVFTVCTLAEMIERKILDHIDDPHGEVITNGKTDGFSLGTNGYWVFYHWDFTPNGKCKLYEQDAAGNVIGKRYVDANKQIVTVWKKS